MLQGEREMAEDNKSLAQFRCSGHPAGAARRAADPGHLRHRRQRHRQRDGAKDLGTGKEQSVRVVRRRAASPSRRSRASSPRRTPPQDADDEKRELAPSSSCSSSRCSTLSERALGEYGQRARADGSRGPGQRDRRGQEGARRHRARRAAPQATATLESLAQKIGEAMYAAASGGGENELRPRGRLLRGPRGSP